MKTKQYLAAVSLTLISVVSTYFVTVSTATPAAPANVPPDLDYQTGGTLYAQKAAEYRALTYQAYNLARMQLDADLDNKRLLKADKKRPRAVMLDIDDT